MVDAELYDVFIILYSRMYYVQDAHSFWDWIYFVLLIVVSV